MIRKADTLHMLKCYDLWNNVVTTVETLHKKEQHYRPFQQRHGNWDRANLTTAASYAAETSQWTDQIFMSKLQTSKHKPSKHEKLD